MTFTIALFIALGAAGDASSALQNPDFESTPAAESWQVVTYGAPADVAGDEAIRHQGHQALRVSAAEPSDTALGQEIALRPGGWYQFEGWVRTRGLDPLGAPVSGTFQIQRAGGTGTLAAGPSHRGDTDWTAVDLVFQAPADGRARIAPFLVGFGKGRGTAWFDALSLKEIDPAQAPAAITKEPLRPGRIDPKQYGQFIEYLCTLVPGMWADKLCDGGFEGLSPYKGLVYLKETDFRDRPWYPCGATNRARYTRDESTKIGGDASLKIAVEEPIACTVGVAQDGLAIERGVACELTCYLKQQGLKRPVTVRLVREGTTYASCELEPTAEWARYHARLVPTGTDDRATIRIEFGGPATLWIDSASLMPEDAVGGWRRDVVAAVRELKPGVIRFGGSALDVASMGDFEWRDTIGPPERRRTLRAWGGLQPAGAGLEEIVQFCRLVDAEPLVCVRVTQRTPQDAAQQVQYFNGDETTPMGAERARNGHREPYRIRYWQVGNELSGNEYEARLPEFCRAMKAADPTIELLSSYPTRGVIRGAGDLLSYVCPHHYDCANLAACEADLESIRRLIRADAPDRPIRVAVTEWNTTAGDAGPRRARLWTLENALACARYQNLLHRHCDLVAIANRSNLVNSFCSGCIQTDNHRLYVTPVYHAQRLYATLAGDRPLRIESSLPSQAAPDLSATLSARGDAVVLLAVNDGLTAVKRPLDFSAFGDGRREMESWTLADTRKAGEPDATNSFAEPGRVSAVRSTFSAASPQFEYEFPALSLTVLRWPVPSR